VALNIRWLCWTLIITQRFGMRFPPSSAPVCWSCHIAESFRRTHPELIVDRPWERGAMGEYIGEDAEQNESSPSVPH
jgi:hypothetical protein